MSNLKDLMNNLPTNAVETLKRLQAEKSLKEFVKQSWGILNKGKKLKWNWHLDVICDHLECVTATYIQNAGLNNKSVDKEFNETSDPKETAWTYNVPEKYIDKPINTMLLNVPPRHGKNIANSVDVLTPGGWKKHGDLKAGDYVFSPSGKTVKILAVTEEHGPDDYVVELTNGDSIRCHENHEWTVYNRVQKRYMTVETNFFVKGVKKTGKQRKLTSGETGKRGGHYQYQLENINPLEFEEKDLPIDPYFFGVWLGDGRASNTDFVYHPRFPEPRTEIERRGMVPTWEALRELDVWNNKHIPRVYLESSFKQRIDLLAGLIDSDGHVEKNKNRVRIATVSPSLRDDIIELLTCLGLKPYCNTQSPSANLKNNIVGRKDIYSIGFQPTFDIPTQIKHKKTTRFVKQRRTGIKSVTFLPNGEMGKCIQVDSKDGLYLVGRNLTPTHNSTIINVFWPAWEWGPQRLPFLRYMRMSYSQHLSTRDGLASKRIIESKWYQERWGHVFQLSESQNAKLRYDNNTGGYNFSTSTGSMATGDGGDRVLCLPGDQKILTDNGALSIGFIVERKVKCQVLSFDHKNDKLEFQDIEAYEKNNGFGRDILEFTATNRKEFKCTSDHPIYIIGKGYIDASDAVVGDSLFAGAATSKIKRIRKVKNEDTVYNIRVAKNHNYFVNGFLVHNCDDPSKAADANSSYELNRVIDLWKDTLSTRIDNPNAGCYVVVMQRIAPNDLAGYLIEQKENGGLPDLNHICLPARYEKDHPHQSDTVLEFVDPRTEEGEPLDKNRFDDKSLKRIEASFNSWAAAGQLQQRPRAKEGGIIQVERIKMIDSVPENKIVKKMRFWDKAASEGAGSSKTVGVLLGQMEKSFGFACVVLDVVYGHWSVGKRDQKIRYVAEKDGVEVTVIIEQEPGSGGKESAQATAREVLNGFNVKIDKVSGSKEARLQAFASAVDYYNVACLKNEEWTKDYLQGLEDCLFGNNVTDFGDASSGCYNWLFGHAGAGKKKKKFMFPGMTTGK